MTTRKTFIGAMLGVAALMLALFAAPAVAQDYPPAGPTVTVSPSSVAPGGSITVTISGFAPGDVTIAFNPTLGTITADATGSGSGTFTVPADTAPGDYTLTATQGDLVASTGLTVTGAAAADAGDLPRTGTDGSLPMTQTAVAAIAAGGLMVLVANKRRKATIA